MGLRKCKLKGLIEYSDSRNVAGEYTENDVIGISTEKTLIPTKADLDGVNLLNYKLFPPNFFAFVADTSRRGDKIALAYNNTNKTFIVSTWYVVFQLSEKAKDVLFPDYLFLYFNRKEFDRYTRINSWGSAREYFWFSDMEEIEIDLPPLSVQQKYVDVYKSMIANQQSYERGLEDLKLTIDALVDDIKHSAQKRTVGKLLSELDTRNENSEYTDVQGINIQKQFMPSVADLNDVKLDKYKIVNKGEFAYSGMQTGRDECIRIAFYNEESPIIISPAYTVLEVKDKNVLPEYIMIWFSRKESDRRGWFMSDASIRSNLELGRFFETELPIPDLKVQKAIVEIYSVYNQRKAINEQLKAEIKAICPILIRGSLIDGG